MAFNAAKNTNFELDNGSATLTDISAYTDTSDLDQKLAAIDTTVFGDSAKAYIAGLSDASISIGGNWNATVDTAIQGAQAALAAGTNASSSWQYGPAGSGTGNPKYTGECIITDYKVSGAVAGQVKWTATLQVTGAVTLGTF